MIAARFRRNGAIAGPFPGHDYDIVILLFEDEDAIGEFRVKLYQRAPNYEYYGNTPVVGQDEFMTLLGGSLSPEQEAIVRGDEP